MEPEGDPLLAARKLLRAAQRIREIDGDEYVRLLGAAIGKLSVLTHPLDPGASEDLGSAQSKLNLRS